MIGYVILGFLAAYGVFSALWAIFGWILPDCRGCALVCLGRAEEGVLARYRWLRGAGLLKIPLICVTEETGNEDLEICSREELLSRLEREKKRFDGTGNGDHTGRHQRRGISEL